MVSSLEQLSIYNGALIHLRERRIKNLEENVPTRRYLDEVWNQKFIDLCLSDYQWTFATRTLKLQADDSLTASFGYKNVYELPSDFLNTCAVCSDEYFKYPIRDYNHEVNYIYTDYEEIYIKYISNNPLYGGGYNNWSPEFLHYVIINFAFIASNLISHSHNLSQELERKKDKARKIAINKDFQKKPSRSFACGAWANSRHLGRFYNYDKDY